MSINLDELKNILENLDEYEQNKNNNSKLTLITTTPIEDKEDEEIKELKLEYINESDDETECVFIPLVRLSE